MAQYRTLSNNNKYFLPKETFLMVIHYCRQYPLWERELKDISADTSKAITYDGDRVQTSNDYDPTQDVAIRRAEISRKIDMINTVAMDVAGTLSKWIIEGCCYGEPYFELKHGGIPCGKNLYYKLRRRFYYEMAKRI